MPLLGLEPRTTGPKPVVISPPAYAMRPEGLEPPAFWSDPALFLMPLLGLEPRTTGPKPDVISNFTTGASKRAGLPN